MSNLQPRANLLIHPNVPKPLHKMAPRLLKGSTWWNVTRKESYAKHDMHCYSCGLPQTRLEAHEAYDIDYTNGRVELDEIVALCNLCHAFIHSNLLMVRYEKGIRAPQEYVAAVFNHGFQVLESAGLEATKTTQNNYQRFIGNETDSSELSPFEASDVDWSDWHIMIDGEKFNTIYENEADWATKCVVR
jgi:hypothetical protein